MKRAVVAAALLLGAVLPATASAADTGSLVLTGAGGTSGELVLSAPLALDDGVALLAGGGPYAGALVEPVGAGAPALGALQVRAFRDGTQTAVARLGAATELPAGRYRVTLLGEGAVTATFALADEGARSVRAVTRKRVPVTFLGRAEDVLDGRSRASVVFPRSLPAGRRALVATLMRGVRVDDLRACATSSGTCPSQGLPVVGTDDTPALTAQLVSAASSARDLVFSVDGYRELPDDLRAVAVLLP